MTGSLWREDRRRDRTRFFDYRLPGAVITAQRRAALKLAIRKGHNEIAWRTCFATPAGNQVGFRELERQGQGEGMPQYAVC
jgi:hypothetical protein